jgi:hypothetical protein
MSELKKKILQASAYAHIKASEEFSRLALTKHRDSCLEEYNKITEELEKLNKNEK